MLKQYKADFKKLVKTNCIKFSSDVTFEAFEAAVKQYDFFEKLSEVVKRLLHEYYQFKIKEKERDRLRKSIKGLTESLK